MIVTVVLPAKNAEGTIGDQLEALAGQKYGDEWELIVVDDHSIDRTIEVAERYRNRVPLRILTTGGGSGVNRARNIGVESGRGELIALCDADDVCADEWLQELVLGLSDYDLVGGALDEQMLNSRIVRSWRPQRPPDRLPVALGYMPYAVSANMGFHRRVWEAIGGFDEHVSRGGSEVDFSWRAQETGFGLGFVPGAVVHYRLRTSLRAVTRQSYWYGRGDVRLARSRDLGRPLAHSIARFFQKPRGVAWWRWAPGRLMYGFGYALGSVTERLDEGIRGRNA